MDPPPGGAADPAGGKGTGRAPKAVRRLEYRYQRPEYHYQRPEYHYQFRHKPLICQRPEPDPKIPTNSSEEGGRSADAPALLPLRRDLSFVPEVRSAAHLPSEKDAPCGARLHRARPSLRPLCRASPEGSKQQTESAGFSTPRLEASGGTLCRCTESPSGASACGPSPLVVGATAHPRLRQHHRHRPQPRRLRRPSRPASRAVFTSPRAARPSSNGPGARSRELTATTCSSARTRRSRMRTR